MMRGIVILALVGLMTVPAFAGVPGGTPTGRFVQGAGGTPAPRDWPNDVVKWSQLDSLDAYAAASWVDTDTPSDATTADDWLCTTPGWLSDIRFYGWSYYGETYLTGFRVSIWSDIAALPGVDESHPGTLLWTRDFGPANQADPNKIGYQTFGTAAPYEYRINVAQTDWFEQMGTLQTPTVYWISIEGLMLADGFFDAWYWNFRNRTSGHNLDDGAFKSTYFGYGPWANWGVDGTDTVSLYDGAFPAGWTYSLDLGYELSFVPEPGTLALLGLGALLLRRR